MKTRRLFLICAVIIAVWIVVSILKSGFTPVADTSTRSALITEMPNGAVRLYREITACSGDDNLPIIAQPIERNDMDEAPHRFGCITIEPQTDLWVEEHTTGFACVRPPGEDRCYWIEDETGDLAETGHRSSSTGHGDSRSDRSRR